MHTEFATSPSTLPDITQKRDSYVVFLSVVWVALNAEAHWHLGPYSSVHHWRSQWQTWLHACVKAKGRHFEELLWSSHTTGSEPLRHTETSSFQLYKIMWVSFLGHIVEERLPTSEVAGRAVLKWKSRGHWGWNVRIGRREGYMSCQLLVLHFVIIENWFKKIIFNLLIIF